MNLYRCRWPNGDTSFVLASTKKEACYYLDQFADPDPRWVERIPEADAAGFLVGFEPVMRPDGEIEWDSDGDTGQEVYELLGDEEEALEKRKAANLRCGVDDKMVPHEQSPPRSGSTN